jgi:H+-translocating NAD(P) transhydrogenase subunit alpha
MLISTLAPTREGERRAALTPAAVEGLIRDGHAVTVEPGSGTGAGFDDDAYRRAGAAIGSLDRPDLVIVIEPPTPDRITGARAVLGLLEPLDHPGTFAPLAATGATMFAFELLPRTTRAQAADALSSQATVAGYQAALEAAVLSDRLFPMLTTAAGTLRPAAVLVLGAGVAGLQALATAKRLGAVVSAFDVRAAAAEAVESLGGRFVEVGMEPQDETAAGGYARELEGDSEDRVRAGLFQHVSAADAVITTAAVPGRAAPRLVTREMLAAMRTGAVVVDGAASTGGNCEVSEPGSIVEVDGVLVSAPLDLASRAADHASQLYGRNVATFIGFLSGDNGELSVDPDDDIVTGAMAARDGRIVHDRVRDLIDQAS